MPSATPARSGSTTSAGGFESRALTTSDQSSRSFPGASSRVTRKDALPPLARAAGCKSGVNRSSAVAGTAIA
jgi:hypothetical protein